MLVTKDKVMNKLSISGTTIKCICKLLVCLSNFQVLYQPLIKPLKTKTVLDVI